MYFTEKKILSYFAKPNFLIYDEWFDDDLEKTKVDAKNKKTISNIHQFFYEQSIYKVGASENNMEVERKLNEKELILNNYFKKTSEKYSSVSNKRFRIFENFTNGKLKFSITKKLIYSLTILGLVFIFGFLLFFVSQSKKNDSRITNKSIALEKVFMFSKRNC